MKYAKILRLPRQQFLVVDKNDQEQTRFPTLKWATRVAAELDERFPENAPHWVRAFRKRGVA